MIYFSSNVTDTSKQAFEKILPELGERQLSVYKAIRKLEFTTNAMVSDYLNLPINCITPRCNELRKKGLVERSHISRCPITKKTAQYWKINDLNKMEEKI